MKTDLNYMITYARADKALVDDLLARLGVEFSLSKKFNYSKWIDDDIYSHNEEGFTEQITNKMEESDFVLLGASPIYFTRDFIKTHEIPIIAREENKKLAILVSIKPLDYSNHDLMGFEKYNFFNLNGKSYAECISELEKDAFAHKLFLHIQAIMESRTV